MRSLNRCVLQTLIVHGGIATPAFGEVVEVFELDQQDGGLHGVQPEVAAHALVDVSLAFAVVAELSHDLGEGLVGGENHPAFTETAEIQRLRKHIRPVLEAGLAAGGTSLGDMGYLLPDGRAGDYMARLAAYGREDEPCRRCGTAIRREVLRGRSTFFCPSCQQ